MTDQVQKTQEIAEAFKKDFAALMAKYNCEMSVHEETRSYYTEVVGVVFEFNGIYENNDVIRPFFEVNVGKWANKDNV